MSTGVKEYSNIKPEQDIAFVIEHGAARWNLYLYILSEASTKIEIKKQDSKIRENKGRPLESYPCIYIYNSSIYLSFYFKIWPIESNCIWPGIDLFPFKNSSPSVHPSSLTFLINQDIGYIGIHSFIHSFIHPFLHPFIHPLIFHSFPSSFHSFPHLYT